MARVRHIAIFTTACLPWMTGTAINPLFRAAYLAKDGGANVTLVVPWLSLQDQELVYPNKLTFESPTQQEDYIRQWLEERTKFAANFSIRFYPGKFSIEKRSILVIGDLTEFISDTEADVAVLEEPEHLTWYHHGQRWKSKFKRVIGVVHTNYLEYVKREKNGFVHAFLLKLINNWVTNIYCHKIIRLSAATQDLPRSIVCNVHGVNPKFLSIGQLKHEQVQKGERVFNKGAYYIGKMVWSKGYSELLNLLKFHEDKLFDLEMDLFGSGEDHDEVQKAASNLKSTVRVHPGRDHADFIFHDYKVFINPSVTDVVCTTTAEALAMGKIVVCANHPSNDFFKQFSNCRVYDDKNSFLRLTLEALSEEPTPLTDEERHELSWEAATKRFLDAADLDEVAATEKPLPPPSQPFTSLSLNMAEMRRNIDEAFASVHYNMSGNETVRRAFGAIPESLYPDEQQCKELGLPTPLPKRRWKR